MSGAICSDCENNLSSENRYLEDSESQSSSTETSIPVIITKNKRRPPRTSTPLQNQENNPPANFSDSVNDFFYQSWKTGLHPNDTTNHQEQQCVQMPQPNVIIQQVPSVTQVVFVNPVVVQPLITPSFQQVGFLPDGTVVLLPTYVQCNGYLI